MLGILPCFMISCFIVFGGLFLSGGEGGRVESGWGGRDKGSMKELGGME